PTRPTRRPAPGDTTTPDTPDGGWLMLAVLLLGQFMCLVDVLVVNVAMPSIARDLHASRASLQLVVGGYTIAYAMLLITGARLGDRCGRRRMYLAGAGTAGCCSPSRCTCRRVWARARCGPASATCPWRRCSAW